MQQATRTPALILSFVALAALGGRASAEVLDLTGNNPGGTINGAQFVPTTFQPAGTGVIDPFLRLQHKDFEQGYNTDFRGEGGNKVEFDQKTDANYTRSLLLSEVPTVKIGDTNYREFILDINEPSGDKSKLSLDQLQIFQGTAPDLHDYGAAESNLGQKIYDMDAGGNNTVLLDYDRFGGGSGKGDLAVYIPDSLFNTSIPYVYLYSAFGDDIDGKADGDSQAGFEEWAVRKGDAPPVNEIPAPATLVFAALGCGLGLIRYARNDKRTPAGQA